MKVQNNLHGNDVPANLSAVFLVLSTVLTYSVMNNTIIIAVSSFEFEQISVIGKFYILLI